MCWEHTPRRHRRQSKYLATLVYPGGCSWHNHELKKDLPKDYISYYVINRVEHIFMTLCDRCMTGLEISIPDKQLYYDQKLKAYL